MKQAALLNRPGLAMPPPLAAVPARPDVLVQAKSGLGGGGAMAAAPIVDAGRPLDPGTRSSMENGFGQDFGKIRVHNDARAHDNARDLNARAYAAGDHIVFGEGHYRPETATGQALIAHELAHSVQQGGVQMKADGPLPAGTDAELEGQADRAAAAVTAGRTAPALSRIGAPAVFRAPRDQPGPSGGTKSANPAAIQGLPSNWRIVEPNPPNPGSDRLVIEVSGFELPEVKGRGEWVQEVYDAHKPNRLIFSPLFRGGKGASVEDYTAVAAYKEGSEKYKDIWLAKYGFTSLSKVAEGFTKAAKNDPKVAAIVKNKNAAPILKGFKSNKLTSAKCDIDHIVEKQLQGSSEPRNLQLLGSGKNQESGRETYKKLVGLVELLKGTPYSHVRELQFRFTTGIKVVKDSDVNDGSQMIEEALRTKLVEGTGATGENTAGKPVSMSAGGPIETMNVLDAGTTPIDFNFKRIVPGMRLLSYQRAKSKSAKFDDVDAVLDGKLVTATGTKKDEVINLEAHKAKTPAAPQPTDVDSDEPIGEYRELKLKASDKKRKIAFHYPYLSPGWIHPDVDSAGNTTGTGEIKASVPMLGNVGVKFGPDLLAATAPLDPKKLKVPIPGFRFTGGQFELKLSPNFVPSGTVNFEIGPAKKPIVVGDVTAKVESGVFIAEGNIKPGPGIPGAENASGKLRFDTEKGWSGRLDIHSNAIKYTEIKAAVIMQQKGNDLDIDAEGGAKVTVKDKTFELKAVWARGGITYTGRAKWEKPFPIVDSIQADVYYRDEYLKITGGGSFRFRAWKGDIKVVYERFSNDRVKVAGDGNVEVETKDKKGKGSLEAHIDETGKIWGKGKIAYQITPTIRPELEVELDKEDKLHITGSLTLGPYTLFDRWPKDGNDKHEIFSIKSPKFTIPTPILGVTVYARLTASVGYGLSIGPAMVESIAITGSFDPLEENPNVVAKLVGKFDCPFSAEVYGTLGARIGAEVGMGLGSLEGGVDVTPSLNATARAKAVATGEYAQGNFTVGVKPSIDLSLDAKLDIDGKVTAEAAWGLWSKTWKFDIASFTHNLGKKTIDFGELKASFGSGQTMPGVQEKAALPKLDPMDLIMNIIDKRNEEDKPNPNYDANARPPAGYAGAGA